MINQKTKLEAEKNEIIADLGRMRCRMRCHVARGESTEVLDSQILRAKDRLISLENRMEKLLGVDG